jgi:hypothetical protein
MKKLCLFGYISAFFIFTNFSNSPSNVCWIRLEYLGDVSKPFPIIIFYTGNSIDTAHSTDTTIEDMFSRKIQVSDVEFSLLNESIRKISIKSQFPRLKDSFAVIVRQDNQTEVFKTPSVDEIKQIFDSVIVQLNSHENIRNIEKYINQFRRRLGVPLSQNKHKGVWIQLSKATEYLEPICLP